MKKITINDEVYVLESDIPKQTTPAKTKNKMKYVIVRTYSAGVFAGYLEKRTGQEVTLRDARRLRNWVGAASLSELSTKGTSNPKECKFPCEVDKVELLNAIEILDVTQKAKDSIASVPVWTTFTS